MSAVRKWTAEEKADMLLEILATSISTTEVCRKYNVIPTLLYTWRASFVHAGIRGLSGTDASNREKYLEQENKRLKEMVAADLALANEFLKRGGQCYKKKYLSGIVGNDDQKGKE